MGDVAWRVRQTIIRTETSAYGYLCGNCKVARFPTWARWVHRVYGLTTINVRGRWIKQKRQPRRKQQPRQGVLGRRKDKTQGKPR